MFKYLGVFLFAFLNASYIIEVNSTDYLKLKNLGINCVKHTNDAYLCNKSDDKYQVKRFINFAEKYNIKTKVIPTLSKDLINVYSIQILSGKNLSHIRKLFKKYENLPYARIEKIGNYYTIRIGATKNKKELKKLLRKVKKGFIRVADIKLNRIIEANFIKSNVLKGSFKNISKKDSQIISLEDYKKLCDFYTIKSIIDPNRYIKQQNEVCYKYHIKRLKNIQSDFEKISEIQEALKYKKTIPLLIELNYLKAKTFQSVDNKFLNSVKVNTLSQSDYSKYLKTLLYAGEIKKIDDLCAQKFVNECNIIYKFLKDKSVKDDSDVICFQNFINDIQKDINEYNLYQAKININKLYNINKNSSIANFYNSLFNLKDENINIKNKNVNYLLKYKYFSQKIKDAYKKIYLIQTKKCLKKQNLKCAVNNINNLLKEYPNDFDVNILAGDIYSRSSMSLADVYYKKAYLLDEKKYFYHLLKLKNYKKLINHLNELKKYPDLFSKAYLYLANKYYNKKAYKKALKYALRAYKIIPSKQNAVLIGKIYFSLKEYKKTIQYLSGLNSDEMLTYYLAISYYKLGDIKMAERLFDKLSHTHNKKILSTLIRFYMSINKQNKIKKLLNNF